MKNYDAIVIGAGAAGLMTAYFAPINKNILLLEKNEFVGRKILATGNGRCNLTNKNITIDRYHGATPDFIKEILDRFTQDQTIELFENFGVILKEEERGRIFPRTNQATTVVEALKHAIERENITVKTGAEVKEINKIDGKFIVKTNKESFGATKLILTTGGKASFQFGSSGDGLFWAKNLGHKIIPIFAALVPLETNEVWVKEVQGIKVEAKVTTQMNNEILMQTQGDVLFTHFGLSGPAIMAQAGRISPFVENNNIEIILDLYPEISEQELDHKLVNIFSLNNKKSIKNALIGLFPAALVPIVLGLSDVSLQKNAAELSKIERQKIVKTIKNLKLSVKKVRPLKEAQVSRGGIDTAEVKVKNLESTIIKNLYFAGEILDVDGDSGGFNLQWAWSSGYVVGSSL